ncbi:MAG: hypothetical protein WD845_02545 [Pirellulales bacterium]
MFAAVNVLPKSRRANWLWAAGYAVMVLAVVIGMLAGRRAALEGLTTPEAQAEWEAWRHAEPNQTETGGVKRRPPSSSEPPALVLLRDHFGVMLFGAVFFSSLLFGAVMIATRGALSTPTSQQRSKP